MNRLLPRLSRNTLTLMARKASDVVTLPPPQILDAPELILQIGYGKFVRGFIADFVQQAIAAGDLHGRMLAVQRTPDERMQSFREQDGLYTLIARGQVQGSTVESRQVMASVSRLLDAETAWPQVLEVAVGPELKILTTNVSEGGLALSDSDLLESCPPRGYPGKLTQILYRRWQALSNSEASIAIVPCELMENNGDLARSLVVDQAQRWRLQPAFVDWAQHSLHVANTVVDRIVVGAPDGDRLSADWNTLGYRDDLLNCAEPFYELVLSADEFIQKHFPLDRANSNVRFVPALAPYRTRKVLILNGPHTALAALGWVLGIRTVLDAMRDEHLGPLVETMMFGEIIPALSLPGDMDPDAYAREVLDRFRNPYVRHPLQAICLNCSTKAGTRIFPSVRRHMNRFRRVPSLLALGLASVLLALRDPALQDTHASYIRERWRQANTGSQELRAFTREVLSRQMDWSRETIDLEPVSEAVARLLGEVEGQGLRTVLSRLLNEHACDSSGFASVTRGHE
jgi:tagaturonate reductase